LHAISDSYRGSGRGANEQLNKELIKLIKPLLTDKILDLRVAALNVNESKYPYICPLKY
jgi:hypothetical protein